MIFFPVPSWKKFIKLKIKILVIYHKGVSERFSEANLTGEYPEGKERN